MAECFRNGWQDVSSVRKNLSLKSNGKFCVIPYEDIVYLTIVNTQLPNESSGGAPSKPSRVGTASGVLQPHGTMYVTQVMKAFYEWNSYIAVQNASADTASVTVHYYDANGNDILQNTKALHPYSTYVFRQENEAGLPSNFRGSAKVVSNKDIAVICNFYNTGADAAHAQFHSYNGFASGATKLYAPRLVKDYYGYQSGLKVQNTGTQPTTVTVSYNFGGTTYVQRSSPIAPGQAWELYLGDAARLPYGTKSSKIARSIPAGRSRGFLTLE